MPLMVEVCSDKTLWVFQSRSTLGTQRPSVFGANIYNQHLGFSSDSDEADTYPAQPTVANCLKSEAQGAVNGPVLQYSNLQRIKRHIQHTEFYSARCSATMSSSDSTERRKQQQQLSEANIAVWRNCDVISPLNIAENSFLYPLVQKL